MPGKSSRDSAETVTPVVYALQALSCFFLIGWVILRMDAIWIIYRITKGWLYFSDRKPMYR